MRSFLWLHKKIIIALVLSALLLSLRGIDFIIDRSVGLPSVRQGVLDLSRWDFGLSGMVELNGEWEFIAGRLVEPEYWETYIYERKFAKVPGAWNADLDGEHPTPFGIGTYRLRVMLPDPPNGEASVVYGFRISHIRLAHKLLINGIATGGLGVPASDSKDAISANNIPYTVFADVRGNTADIVLMISNYWRGSGGGIMLPISMGLPSDVQMNDKIYSYFDIVIASIALINALIAAGMYISQRRQLHLLYFSLLHLFGVLYILTGGERLLLQIFPEIPFVISFKLLLFSSYGFLFCCYKFIVCMYPEFLKTVPNRLMQSVTAVAVLLLLLDVRTLSDGDIYRLTVYLLASAYLFFLIIKALFAHREDAPYLLMASAALISIGWPDVMLGLNVPASEVPPLDQVVFFVSLLLLAVSRFVQTLRRVEQLSMQRTRMESALLQAQIKPHFLFNSLNTIGSLVETDPGRAQDLIAEFSTYLRYSFDLTNTAPLVQFEQEWKLVEAYLRLEQTRHEGHLFVEADVSAARGLRLPPLTLQPLVENAIRHGLMKRATGGSLGIRAVRKPGAVTIEVSDNGVGIPEALVDVLCTRPLESKARLNHGGGSGIGLYNVHQRLIASFGRQWGLRIVSVEDKGTTVSFQIPEEPIADVEVFAG